jgi:hypothetical protein
MRAHMRVFLANLIRADSSTDDVPLAYGCAPARSICMQSLLLNLYARTHATTYSSAGPGSTGNTKPLVDGTVRAWLRGPSRIPARRGPSMGFRQPGSKLVMSFSTFRLISFIRYKKGGLFNISCFQPIPISILFDRYPSHY